MHVIRNGCVRKKQTMACANTVILYQISQLYDEKLYLYIEFKKIINLIKTDMVY